MNVSILMAAIIAAMATVGHFTMGTKMYLHPLLKSALDEIPKTIMHGLFHYMSAYMLLTVAVLWMAAFGREVYFTDYTPVVRFIGISYLGFALAQLIVVVASGIKGGVFKLFQWIFWMLIAFLTLQA